ncbi:MAG: shikimate kinase, partial [Alphaproteobacteria bacterium]
MTASAAGKSTARAGLSRHAEAFLEMLAAERGAARNTLAAYQADLEDFAGFAATKGVALHGADSALLRAWLAGPPLVLATGGGAFADAATRAAIRASGAVSIWLKCPLSVLIRRVAGREHRPMFLNADPAEVLQRLMNTRHPLYAEADITLACNDESLENTTRRLEHALKTYHPPERVPVGLGERAYEVLVGQGLLARAGGLLAPV